MADWPVAIAPAGHVSVGAVTWRFRAQLRVTVVAKATYAFVPDGVMTLSPASPLRSAEVHDQNDPRRSIRCASDLAPRLPHVDVLLTGHAHAPGGAAVGELPVRLRLVREGAALIDKALLVVGDRAGARGQTPAAVRPFVRMPLTYERAQGGIGQAENPLGTGAAAGPDGRLTLPNIVHPAGAVAVVPAGFAPISAGWPARRRLLGATSRRAIEERIAEIPEGFDWSYFQAAPVDQRILALRGDEWIVLDGMHPTLPRLRTRLPRATGMARVYTHEGIELPLRLTADTVAIDADAERCSVTWRASFPVPNVELLPWLSIVAGADLPDLPAPWPRPPPPLRAQRPGVSAAVPAKPSFDATLTLDEDDFVVGDEAPPRPPAPAQTSSATRTQASSDPLARTIVLPEAELPLAPPAGAAKLGVTTVRATDEPPAAAPAPFPIAAPTSPTRPAPEIAGAPWADAKAAPVPRPRARWDATLDLDEAPEAQPAAAPVPAPAEPAPVDPPVEPPRREAPRIGTASPELRKDLYGKVGRK